MTTVSMEISECHLVHLSTQHAQVSGVSLGTFLMPLLISGSSGPSFQSTPICHVRAGRGRPPWTRSVPHCAPGAE